MFSFTFIVSHVDVKCNKDIVFEKIPVQSIVAQIEI
jgi:hypothetical protein